MPSKPSGKSRRPLAVLCIGIGFIALGMTELAVSHLQSHALYTQKLDAFQSDQDSVGPDAFNGCSLSGLTCAMGSSRD